MWTLESDRFLHGSKDFSSEIAALEEAKVAMMVRVPVYRLLKDGEEVMDQDALHRRLLRDYPNLAK